MVGLMCCIWLFMIISVIESAVIPTSQKASLIPYSFPQGDLDPQHHYSILKDCKFDTLVDNKKLKLYNKKLYKFKLKHESYY